MNDLDIFGDTKAETPASRDADIFKDVKDVKQKAELSPPKEDGRNFLGLPVTSPERAAYIQKTLLDRPWGSGLPGLANDFGGRVTDIATGFDAPPWLAASLGYGTNVLTQALPSFLTSPKIPGQASALAYPASKLMQRAVKPSISDLKSGDAKAAINTMLEEGIYPTESGMSKVAEKVGKLNEEVKTAIANSPAMVNVASVGSRLKDVYNRVINQVNPQSDLDAVKAAWDAFRISPKIVGKTEIPVQLAQQIKSGTYQSLGGKAYGELGSTSVEAQKALARGLREEIANKVPAVVEPLKLEQALLNVKDVAGNRALQEANKNPLGLAALRMDNPLSSVSFLADRWAALKAFLAFQLNSLGKPNIAVPFGVAVGTAAPQLMPPAQSPGALYQ